MTNPEDRTQVKDKQAVITELPNGSTEKVAVRSECTVRDFKVICELQFGIPYNLQKVCIKNDSSVELNDWLQLRESVQTFEEVIVVEVPVWWNKFVCASLNNEIENGYRRAKLPMQQISKEERLFVGYFIACCHGFVGLLEKLNTLEISIDHKATTEAGRNLFHAAAVSGKANCVEFIASHVVDPSKEVLSVLDTNKETPLDIARRFKHHETERVLYKYMYHEKGEREKRSSAESGIDLTEEFEAIDLEVGPLFDVNTQERKSRSKKKQQEPANDSSEEEGSSRRDKEVQLVISECDEGLSFIGSTTKSTQPPATNQLREEANVIDTCEGDDALTRNTNHLQARAPSDASSSDSSEESSSPRPVRPRTLKLASNQPLLQRRFGKGFDLYRPNSARLRHPKISICQEEEEEEESENTHLPPLERQTLVNQTATSALGSPALGVSLLRKKQGVVRTNSTPNTPPLKPRLSPVDDRFNGVQQLGDDLVPKSAPNSPQSPRIVFKPSVKSRGPAVGSLPPSSPTLRMDFDRRRGSEPFPAFSWNSNGTRSGLSRPRREAALITADLSGCISPHMSPIMQRRGKSRSICEATLAETFREQRFVKDMEEEERMDRPWNAWIAARKESLQATNLPTTHEVSPDNCRRMTFEQWLSEKELQHLRSLFASAQEAANTNEKQAKLLKGKSFEEWVEDKRKDIEREREKEREVEDQQKEEQEKKDRRQKISRQKYEKWLMQKDLGALEEEEKLVQQAKQKLEIMKKKWEEEDQKKKDRRTVVGRTRSLPVETPLLNRHTRTK